MSTRSRIGIQGADGSIRSIYCHFDGYLEGVGATLEDAYTDPEKVSALIELGDLSSLDNEVAPAPGVPHSYGAPAKGVTVAYHRDRGEDAHPAAVHANDAEYASYTKDRWGEYAYLFRDGQWSVNAYPDRDYSVTGNKFIPLADAIAAEQAENDADEAEAA